MRFSPGYGDWAIQNQKDFLQWLGADKLGITLAPSLQMMPRKSVSALLGIINKS
jgi:cobalamin-dependent methionine synthase I